MPKLYKFIFFVLLCPFISIGQRVSVLPTHFPDYIYGTWVDKNNDVVLIVSQDYIVVKSELYGYNNIIKDNEKLHFTCISNYNVKYISVSKINESTILLDEGFVALQLFKTKTGNTSKFPKNLVDIWYSSKTQIELLDDKVLFSDVYYKVDYVATANNINYHVVLYSNGEYYLINNFINTEGNFINTNFEKPITFKKESFFKKYKMLFAFLSLFILFVIVYILLRWKIVMTKKKEVAKRLFVEMQLKSIRSQMNPHFLFNALSAIQNLINKGDNENANHYLTEFSQLMRLTLDKSEKGVVPLIDEIESVKKYLELEKLRFQFDYAINIDSRINAFDIEIPAMLIQPFVENAIIHGLMEKKENKIITITFKKDENFLICNIKDNGVGILKAQLKKEVVYKGKHYGLKLAKDRIAIINESYNINTKVKIIDISQTCKGETGTLVEIILPLQY